MKNNKLLLFLLFINIISSSDLFNGNYYTKLRNLWDNNLEYTSRGGEDGESLLHCANSSPKYFAYILTGANYRFSDYADEGFSVSIIL